MNISHHIERAATFFPDKTAILFEGLRLTYRDLNARVNRLANALKANGLSSGKCAALYLPNIPQFAICYLATVRIGAIALSINSMYKSEELNYIPGYGLTECSLFACYNHDFRHKFSSVGTPIEYTESTATATWPPARPRRGWSSYRNCPKARPARS